MTSKDRVLASLNHQQPDRIPVDLSGYRSSGISAIAYPKLRAALGLEPRSVDVYDPVQQLAICHEDVLDLRVSTRLNWAEVSAMKTSGGLTGCSRMELLVGCRSGRSQKCPAKAG